MILTRYLSRWPLALTLGCAACGSSPAAPTPTPVPVTPTQITLSGHVTATNGGQPLIGLQAALGTATTATDATGGFLFQMPPTGTLALALTGSGIVPRSVYVAAGSTRSVTLDAIATAGFDLNFYREFVRNSFDAPATLQPLRRWTRNPSIYLMTVDEAGGAIDAQTLDATERAIRETLPAWTAGRFTLATLERGTTSHINMAGWLTVTWPAEADPTACGRATVGTEGAAMRLYYRTGGGCRCPGVSEVRPRTVRHELGHAMGFYHTDNAGDVMSDLSTPGCDLLPSARELAAAAIAYARPVGNLDPDQDPSGTVNLAPMSVR